MRTTPRRAHVLSRSSLKQLLLPLSMLVIVIASLFFYSAARAVPTVLSPNDIVIVTANSDSGWSTAACSDSAPGGPNSNAIDFLLRRDIGAGTVFKVTDGAWTGTALSTSAEGIITYTAATDMPAGTAIRYSDCLYNTGSSGWTRSTPLAGFDTAVTGDTLLVYQGTEASPSFIYGFGFRSNSWIASGTPSSNNSRIPAVLASASPAAYMSLGTTTGARNYQYTTTGNYGIYSSTFLSSLKLAANWNTSGAATAGTPFGPTAVPFDATRPTFSSVVRQLPTDAVTSATSVTFRVTTSEAVQALSSSNFTLTTTGTIGYGSISVATVSGSQYNVTITGLTGEGTIALNSYTASLLDLRGNPALSTSFTSPVYTRDVTDPVVTVNALTTNQSQPALSGTVSDAGSEVVVTVNGVNYTAALSGTTWTLPAGTITPALADGTYDVEVMAADLAGNIGIDSTTNELIIDTTGPTVTINQAVTQPDPTNVNAITYTVEFSEPIGSGSFTASDVVIGGTLTGSVSNITQVNATTWTVTISGALSGQTVTATIAAGAVTDTLGNTSIASTSTDNSVLYDATQPQIFAINVDVNSVGTTMEQPIITFAATDAESGIDRYEVSVDGGAFTIQSSGYQPTLTVATSHTITIRAYDRAGNVREQTVTYPPTVSIIAPTTQSNGAITDTTVTIGGPAGMIIDTVTITGATGFNCGTLPRSIPFTCAGGSVSMSGTVTVTAYTSTGVSVANSQAYTIDTIAPTVTINPVSTTSTSPALSGAIDDPTAIVSVTINGVNYTALNDGIGGWSLSAGIISPALSAGTYDVIVSAVDTLGNTGSDTTTNELVITAVTVPGDGTGQTPDVIGAPNTGAGNDATATLLFIVIITGLAVGSLIAIRCRLARS